MHILIIPALVAERDLFRLLCQSVRQFVLTASSLSAYVNKICMYANAKISFNEFVVVNVLDYYIS